MLINLKNLCILFCIVAFSACSTLNDKKVDDKAKAQAKLPAGSVESLYAQAKEELEAGGWQRAIELYEQVQAQDALGVYGRQSMLDGAYAQWRFGESALALAAIDRYLKIFPKSDGTPYALYLKGIINFNERSGLLTKLSGEDLSERDPKQLREAYDVFQRIVKEYPDSKYAPEASQRLIYIVNTLAKYEVGIALYYLLNNAPVAAINRAQNMLKQYSSTPAQEEALGIIIESYRILGLTELKEAHERILRINYPNSRHLTGAKYTRPTKSFFALW